MKSKKLKSIVAMLLSVAMLISFASCGGNESNENENNDSAGTSSNNDSDMNNDKISTLGKNSKVGDYVAFGSYEQDGDTSNGKETIEWLVLDVQDGKALIISKYALDCKPYNEAGADVTWETCTLRTWLNNDFYETAFSDSEKNEISTTNVASENNPNYDTEAGNSTQDKVFLLSIGEAEKYFSSGNERMCKPTQYAVTQGIWQCDEPGKSYDDNCYWWIRTPGYLQYMTSYVDYFEGGFSDDSASISIYGVRPALWVNI